MLGLGDVALTPTRRAGNTGGMVRAARRQPGRTWPGITDRPELPR